MLLPEVFSPGVLSWEERLRNIEYAMSLNLPELEIRPAKGRLTLACYGPSLKQTFRDIAKPFMSVSGAHDFLIEHGRIPTYHVEADPRPHKAGMLTKANDQTEYLVASMCAPEVFEALKGRKVTVFHYENGPESEWWIKTNKPHAPIIGGGSTVGLRALEIAHVLGYRSLEIHGMDSCFEKGGRQWAGAHTGQLKKAFPVSCGGKTFWTSTLMVQAAREFVAFWLNHNIPVRMKGDGLIKQMMKQSERKAA